MSYIFKLGSHTRQVPECTRARHFSSIHLFDIAATNLTTLHFFLPCFLRWDLGIHAEILPCHPTGCDGIHCMFDPDDANNSPFAPFWEAG